MFSLIHGLWKYMFSKTEFHVLILGIDKAGKTTLLEKLKEQYLNLEGLPPDRIVPTVGLNIGRIEVANTKLVFWDLGGQPGLRSIWEKYYEEAHAVLYVVDANSPSRFEDSKSALEKVLRHQDLQGAPLLILANKQDISSAESAAEVARYLDLKKLDERAYMFEGVSAYDGLARTGNHISSMFVSFISYVTWSSSYYRNHTPGHLISREKKPEDIFIK